MTTKNTSKNIKIFECKKCDYICSKKGDWNRHLLTRKHNKTTKTTEITSNYIKCNCGKEYKERTALWRHKQKCKYTEIEYHDDNNNYKEMFLEMVNQNNEIMDKLLKKDEQMGKIIPLIGNNNNNNTQFNINVFLNEDCKDALNIKDFVDSLQLQLKDLENTGKLGFVEGTSKIFIDGLNKLEITKRPIHCSDITEETLYIKDNDTWAKENKNNDKMKKAIDEITDANMKQMPEWVKENPTFANDEEYLKVISNIMNVMDSNKQNKQKEQIINNVAKEIILDE